VYSGHTPVEAAPVFDDHSVSAVGVRSVLGIVRSCLVLRFILLVVGFRLVLRR
jgi:hypothetical protein